MSHVTLERSEKVKNGLKYQKIILLLFKQHRYPCLVPSTLEKAIIELDNVFLKCKEEWGTSRSIALWEIERDVLELKLRCSNIKISSYSRHGEPHWSIMYRIKSWWKLLTEIIKCYEDTRIVKRSIEIQEALEHRKRLQYSFEILCHDNAFHHKDVGYRYKQGGYDVTEC
ncbi:hypothetical protein K435DRAFT_813089 [Dendrothele bispora CBS 962.96]|uniref:Uncharacterized protein n=1 Tax=Dendrothele bispora (strain CBS 962.96) TaxID=1314807 RepID=A0A4S8KME0_DENBC|nr:hypothetical protein K435DRAFT_813089 [Dendrothele bispora CBS 962.96]